MHLPTEGHLDCLQVLTITNKVPLNIFVQVFVWTQVFNSFGIPSSRISGLYANSMFSFCKKLPDSSSVAMPFCIPTSNE